MPLNPQDVNEGLILICPFEYAVIVNPTVLDCARTDYLASNERNSAKAIGFDFVSKAMHGYIPVS